MNNIKVSIKNIGPLKEAEFEVGDLTIICGENNTGKTYAAYAFYGYLDFTTQRFFSIQKNYNNEILKEIYSTGSHQMPLDKFQRYISEYFEDSIKIYSSKIHEVFSSTIEKFKETQFTIQKDLKAIRFLSEKDNKYNLFLEHSFEKNTELINNLPSSIMFKAFPKNDYLEINTPFNFSTNSEYKSGLMDIQFQMILQSYICSYIFPFTLLASSERTGTTIFQRIVDVTQDRLINFLKRENVNVPIQKFLKEFTGNYTSAVKNNIDIVRIAYEISLGKSYLLTDHPDIYNDFQTILGGDYIVDSLLGIRFVPKESKGEILTLEESSSTVRSLVHLGLYLKYQIQKNNLLIIDEPELNLHPNNQRKLARLLARLVNVGIRVFITTHSDYIIREFNTLILLNQDKPYLKKIMEEEGYEQEELLNVKGINAYITEPVPLEKDETKPSYRLKPCTVMEDFGIEAVSFNETIDAMNRTQEKIYWTNPDAE